MALDRTVCIGVTFRYRMPREHPYYGGKVYEFLVRAGDDPNLSKLQMLLPGALYTGKSWGLSLDVVQQHSMDPTQEHRMRGGCLYPCAVHAGTSVFRMLIWARDRNDLWDTCKRLGAVRPAAWAVEVTAWQRLVCRLRYLWERRPQLRLRDPSE